MCRLRPWTFLPPSIPRSLPPSAVRTDWLSIAAALGVGARPAWTRVSSDNYSSRSHCLINSVTESRSLPQEDVTKHRGHAMSDKISKQGKRELLEVLRQRYQRAAKQDK